MYRYSTGLCQWPPLSRPRPTAVGWWVWMVVRFVSVRSVCPCARVSRVCPGSPRCLFTGFRVARVAVSVRVSHVCPGSPGVFLPVHVALLRHCCGSDGRCVGLSAPPGAYVHSIEQRAFLVASARTCRTTTDHRGCSVRHLPFMASFIRFAAMRFGVGDDVDTRTTGRATTAP